jgi:hypothetical protein
MQGHWIQWVILLIGVAVWIFTHLLKAGNEQQQQRKRQAQGGNAPARRPAGDIDRFLEEIQRRRRDGEKKRAPAESAPPAPTVRETSRPVKPPPLPRRVERPVERPPLVPPPPPRRRPPEPAPRPQPQVAPPPVELVVMEEVREVERVPNRAPTVTAGKAPTPGAKMLADLLRTRDGLQAAVLLNEVIGPPRCKRPRNVGR